MTKGRLKELTKMVNSKNHDDRIEAAEASDLPLELQEILVRGKAINVRYLSARDEDFSVRYWLAMNTSVVDVKIQEILAKDEDCDVRYWLARNPSCTDRKLWEILRNDEDDDVRGAINKRIQEEKDKIKAEFKEKINKC